jgi:hypothetical protein
LVDDTTTTDTTTHPSALNRLFTALRDRHENEVAMWPPAADFEGTISSELGMAAAAAAYKSMTSSRSRVLLNFSINVLLLRREANDEETSSEDEANNDPM